MPQNNDQIINGIFPSSLVISKISTIAIESYGTRNFGVWMNKVGTINVDVIHGHMKNHTLYLVINITLLVLHTTNI